MFDLLADLDPQQRAVAVSEATRLRVMAGAGTGKTTALTARTAHLIVERRVAAHRVLLLTFTRRAARQMVSRTATLISRARSAPSESSPSQRIVGGTFHSIAHQTLRRNAQALGLSDGFGVIDPSDAADMMDVIRNDVIEDRALRRRLPRKATLLNIYTRAVDTAQPISETLERTAPWAVRNSDEIMRICRQYVQRKREFGVLDFDDLLLYWREALAHPTIGPQIANGYDHVLVDEYQDVNALQVDVLQHLVGGEQTLTVVGDDAQSIYSFRASSPDHILEFPDVFPGAQTLALTTNYRSTQPIIDVANALGSEAPRGFMTTLTACPQTTGNDRPHLIRCADEDGQSDSVCDRVLQLREEGMSLREQAILVRAAHHSGRLEIELTRRGIPFVKYGGLKYLEAAHVKDLLAVFRIVDNPRDELSWFRVLQLLEGVGPAKAHKAILTLGLHSSDGPNGVTLVEVQRRWPQVAADLGRAARQSAAPVIDALTAAQHEPLVIHAERLRAAVAPLIEANYDNTDVRLTDLEALVQATNTAERLCEVAAEHVLEPPHSTGELADQPVIDEDYVVISTVHSAKGLEWDAVHVIHAADGNFPSDMALTDGDGLEEERRLFYVALTRARRSLDIYVPLRFHVNRHAQDDRHIWAQPSRFLAGAVAATLEETTHLRPADFGAIDLPRIDAAAAIHTRLDNLWQ